MRIMPGFEPPVRPPTEQDCLNHLREYLAQMHAKLGYIGHTYYVLRREFPFAEADRLYQETQ
jgi:hypothetical protein